MHQWEAVTTIDETRVKQRAGRPVKPSRRARPEYATKSIAILVPCALFAAWSLYLYTYSVHYKFWIFPAFVAVAFFVGFIVLMIMMWQSLKPVAVAPMAVAQPEPEVVRESNMVHSSADGSRQKIGTIYLTDDKWKALGEVIKKHDGRLIRNNVPDKTFLNITENWASIQKEFVRMEAFEKRGRVLYILDIGCDFFEQYGITIPLPQ